MIKLLILLTGLAPLIDWIRPSFEDNHGQSSYRRLTPFALTGLAGFMVIADKIPDGDRFAALVALLVTSAFYAGLLTFQQIYSIFVSWKGGKAPEETVTVEQTQTTEITIDQTPPDNEKSN